MGRPKKTVKTVTVRSNARAADDLEFDSETESEIDEFFSEHPDTSIVSIYRIGKPGEKDGFLDTVTLPQFKDPSPEQTLRDSYGAGRYRVRLKSPNVQGVMKFAGTRNYNIAEKPGMPVNGATNGVHGPQTMEHFLREESARNHQMLITLIASMKPQQLDLAGLAALLSAVNGGNKGGDLASVVAAFTQLKQSSEPRDPIEQIKVALELARSVNGNGPAPAAADEPEMSWPSLIKGALTAVAGGGRALLPAARNGAGQPEAEEEQPENEEQMFQQFLAGEIGFLKSKAAAGKPVEFWINYVLENPEEPGSKALFMALNAGATFENLLTFDNEIARSPQLRLWFQRFYDGIKSPVPGRASSQNAPLPGPGWDIRDPANHARAGAPGQSAADSATGGAEPGKPGGS